MKIKYISDPNDWADLFPSGTHFLQTYAWGQLKKSVGNTVIYAVWLNESGAPQSAAMLIVKKVGLFRVGYVPRGPIDCGSNKTSAQECFSFLDTLAKNQKLNLLNIDPDTFIGTSRGDDWLALLDENNNVSLARQVQSRGTAVSNLDLVPAVLADMDKSTRYNIRKSTKDGITFEVRPATKELMDTFYKLYVNTGGRKGFSVYGKKYYQTLVRQMNADPLIEPYFGIASHPGQDGPVSMAFLLVSGERAYYFYAASTLNMRNSMPNYGLQWHCLNWAKSTGAKTYDWWGAPFNKDDKKDPMAGVWHFKKSFLPDHKQLVGNHTYKLPGFASSAALHLLSGRDKAITIKRKVKRLLRI